MGIIGAGGRLMLVVKSGCFREGFLLCGVWSREQVFFFFFLVTKKKRRKPGWKKSNSDDR